MYKLLKFVLIVAGISLTVIMGYYTYSLLATFGLFDSNYSKQDLIENYNENEAKITELKSYINQIVPENCSVEIEFGKADNIAIFHVSVGEKNYQNWDLSASSNRMDTLLVMLGWTHETLSTLEDKLDEADCISVSSGDPCNIGFQRSGMGKYSYLIFTKPLADSLRNGYNDSCTYILYKNHVVLEYGGGAIGPQCFEEFKGGEY